MLINNSNINTITIPDSLLFDVNSVKVMFDMMHIKKPIQEYRRYMLQYHGIVRSKYSDMLSGFTYKQLLLLLKPLLHYECYDYIKPCISQCNYISDNSTNEDKLCTTVTYGYGQVHKYGIEAHRDLVLTHNDHSFYLHKQILSCTYMQCINTRTMSYMYNMLT